MTELKLTNDEVRVLGCLIEKEMTTPDYYPLSLNALVNACNQKSNREPVVSYNEETVLRILDSLKGRELVWQSDLSRVAKYAHNFLKAMLAGEQFYVAHLFKVIQDLFSLFYGIKPVKPFCRFPYLTCCLLPPYKQDA